MAQNVPVAPRRQPVKEEEPATPRAVEHKYSLFNEFHRNNSRFRHHSKSDDLKHIYNTHGAKITGINSITLMCYPETRMTLEQAKEAYAAGDRSQEILNRCEVFQDENGINMPYISGFRMEISDYDNYLFRFGREKYLQETEHLAWDDFDKKVVKPYRNDKPKYDAYMNSLPWKEPHGKEDPSVPVKVPQELWHWFLPFLLNIDMEAAVINTDEMPHTIRKFTASEGSEDIVIPGATGFTTRCADYLFEYMRATPSPFVTDDMVAAYEKFITPQPAPEPPKKLPIDAKGKKDYSVYIPPKLDDNIYEIHPVDQKNYKNVDRTRSYHMIRRWMEDNRNHIGVYRMCHFMLLTSIELEIYHCVVQEWCYFPSMAYRIYLTGDRPETYPTIVRARDAKAWRVANKMPTPPLAGDKDDAGVPWLEEYIVDMPEEGYIKQNGFLSNRCNVIWAWYQTRLNEGNTPADNANLKYEEPMLHMKFKYVPRW